MTADPRKIKRGQIVEVLWHDAASHGAGWDSEARCRRWAKRSDGVWNARTTGYVVHVGKRSITLCHSWAKRPDGGISVNYAMSIPRGMAVKYRVLEYVD